MASPWERGQPTIEQLIEEISKEKRAELRVALEAALDRHGYPTVIKFLNALAKRRLL